MKKIFIYVLWVLLSLPTAMASNTLVSNESEYDNAVENATAGDTIILKNGTWNNIVFEFYAEGTEADAIVMTAETAGEVILTGSSRLKIYGKYLQVQNLDFKDGASTGSDLIEFRKSSSELAENCRLTNCRVLNYNPASDATAYKWVSIFGKNNRVDHCTFTGKNNEGALLVVWLNGQANYHRIDHNYFSDIPRLNRNGAETIRIGTSTNSMTESRTVVEHNVFEKCDGELEIISNKSNFNIYRYNTFINNDGGLTLRHGNDCEVYGNFFFGASGKSCGGVRIIGERHRVYNNYFQDLEGTSTRAAISVMNGVPNSPLNRYFQVKEAQIVHNTIVSCRQAFAFGVGKSTELSLPPIDCIVANNVADKFTGTSPIVYTDNPINISYSSNFINSTSLSISDPGLSITNPELVFSDRMWRTQQQGPTENAAISTYSYVTKDVDGQSRDDRPDIGADEFSEQGVLITPLSASDVGSDWERETNAVKQQSVVDYNIYVHNKTLYFSNINNTNKPQTVSIYNANAQQVYVQKLDKGENRIPLESLSGFYIVQITSEGSPKYTKKVWF